MFLQRCDQLWLLLVFVRADAELTEKVEAPCKRQSVRSDGERVIPATSDEGDTSFMQVTLNKVDMLPVVRKKIVVLLFFLLEWSAELTELVVAPTVEKAASRNADAVLVALGDHDRALQLEMLRWFRENVLSLVLQI